MFSFFKKEIRPFDTGYVPVDNGHQIFYQQFGNPNGDIVLSFHSGPGGSGKAKHVSHYDLKKYRVILFDQRGCGKSLFKDAFKENTSWRSVEDGMAILNHLKIKGKITISGASFGAGLALLFSETYPNRVKQIILNSVFLMRPKDAEWVSRDSYIFYPDLMDEMRHQAKAENVVPYYYKLLFSEKYKDIQQAQKYYGSYERLLGEVNPSFDKTPALTDSYIQSGRIYLYYEVNKFFVSDNQILDNISKIKHIPTLIVHNRLDFCCPVYQAYDLHKALPKSKLVIVPDKGHSSSLLFKTLDKEIRKIG